MARLRRGDAAGGRLYMPAFRPLAMKYVRHSGQRLYTRLRRRDDVDIVSTTGGATVGYGTPYGVETPRAGVVRILFVG